MVDVEKLVMISKSTISTVVSALDNSYSLFFSIVHLFYFSISQGCNCQILFAASAVKSASRKEAIQDTEMLNMERIRTVPLRLRRLNKLQF